MIPVLRVILHLYMYLLSINDRMYSTIIWPWQVTGAHVAVSFSFAFSYTYVTNTSKYKLAILLYNIILSYSKIFPLLVSGNAVSYWDSSMRESHKSLGFKLFLSSLFSFRFSYIHSTSSVYITAPYIMQSILNRSLMMYKVMVNCIPTEKHVWMDPRSDRLSQILKTQSP